MEKYLSYLNPSTVEEVTDMMDGDSEMIIDLIDTLLETTPELMDELAQAVPQGDAHAIREAAHALKSSTAQMGALSFSELSRQMEDFGKNQQVSQSRELWPKLQAEHVLMTQALKDWKSIL